MATTTTNPVNSSTDIGSELGTTTVEQDVIAKVAGIAAHDVTGVHALGGAAMRVIGAVRGAMNNTNYSQGITLAVTDDTVSVDVTLSAEYPISLQQLGADVRSAVILAVETIVGMKVLAVNVTVNDIFTPEETTDPDASV
ncbi:Asp23/Gls24 family envelope stress response protein [Microbacterium sp. P01]|uniref:Asp23/Gls24 family envelope stress response protein n=1 Tax=Microbacterium sp. P01 TaxID=3366261 RepID=UPI00366F1EDB